MTHIRITTMLAVLAAAVTNAAAQPAGAQAEVLFRQAKDLMAAGKLVEACNAFDASQKLDPTISTLLNAANCREKNGQLATAWGLYLEAERQTRSGTDDASKQLHQTSADHASKLETRLSTLTISVPVDNRVGGLEILRNGEAVDLGAFNKPLPVDGGTYKISAHAPGNAEWSTTVTVGIERDAQTIEVPKLKAAGLGTAVVPPPPSTERHEAPASSHGSSRLVPVVLGAGAIVVLGGALGFELWGDSTYNQSKAATDMASQTSLWHSANDKRYVAEGLAVAGIGCAGVAVWLFLRGGHEETALTRGGTSVQPVVASDRAGLELAGSW